MVLQSGRLLRVKKDTYNGQPSNSIKVGEVYTSPDGKQMERGVYIDLDLKLSPQEVKAFESLEGQNVLITYYETAKISKAGKAYISRWNARLVDVSELIPDVELVA
jgi:hypothetical protein